MNKRGLFKFCSANKGPSTLRVPLEGWREVVFFLFWNLGRAGGSTEEELCSLRAHSSFKTHAGQFQERQLCGSAEVTHRGFKAGLSIRSGRRVVRLVQAGTVEDKKRHELHSYIKHHSGEEERRTGGSVHSESLLICQHSLGEEQKRKTKLCSIALKAEDGAFNCSPTIAISPSATITVQIFLSAQARWTPRRPTPRPAPLGII